MESLQIDGVIVIKDKAGINGEPLWASLAIMAKKRFQKVQILLTNISKKTIERRYPELTKSEVCIDEIESLENVLSTLNSKTETAFFLDNINLAVISQPIDNVCRILKHFAESGAVVARVNADVISDASFKRLCVVADTWVTLSEDENGTAISELAYFKKGKRSIKKESFVIEDGLRLRCSPYEVRLNINNAVNQKWEDAWIIKNTSFNTGVVLSENERKAKNAIQLPYMSAQNEQGLVGLNISGGRKIRAGGRVIYTPDEADDLDDSDPDDDLQI